MDEDDECKALRRVVEKRCPGVKFKDGDIKKLVEAGYDTETALALASEKRLEKVLPTRHGVVDILIKAFVQPAQPQTKSAEMQPEGEPISKRPKTSPVEDLDLLDQECSYMRYLLAPPDKLPITVAELHEFLAWKSRPLPVSHGATLHSVHDNRLVRLCKPEERSVAQLVESALTVCHLHANNEADSSHILRILTGDFLELLNNLAPAELSLQTLESTMDSAQNPGSAAVSSLVPLMGPDYMLYIRNALILRWENKIDPANFTTARDENTGKLKVWSPLYYGELPYVIGGCCGGRIFEWLKLSPKDGKTLAEPISRKYDLRQLSSVAKLLHSVVQMHRLLQRLQQALIDPVPIQLYKEMKRVNGTIVVGPQYVVKTLIPQLSVEKLDVLQSLYTSIAGSKYLIQLQGEILQLRGSSKLTLYPVGHPTARPVDLKQLENATHDMLHGLSELHKAGYTHRDLRWENCIRRLADGEMKWIIIDMEYAGRDGEIWEGDKLATWDEDEGTLDRTIYSTSSDMYQLGKLILNWLDVSHIEEKRMRALGQRMKRKREQASEMLGDICENRCARCRIFNARWIV